MHLIYLVTRTKNGISFKLTPARKFTDKNFNFITYYLNN